MILCHRRKSSLDESHLLKQSSTSHLLKQTSTIALTQGGTRTSHLLKQPRRIALTQADLDDGCTRLKQPSTIALTQAALNESHLLKQPRRIALTLTTVVFQTVLQLNAEGHHKATHRESSHMKSRLQPQSWQNASSTTTT